MIAILGGGLAGLQLGRRLKERAKFLILEKNPEVGGLCRTLRSGEYSWDVGPHAFYSKRPEAMAYYRALPLGYRVLKRDVRVYHHGPEERVFEVGYPFENGLADLPWAERWECLSGYFKASRARRAGGFPNLREWIEKGLGPGIARHFMLPYNEKIWDCPLERVSMDLVRQKIEPEPAWKILRNSLIPGTVGRAYQSRFIYPEKGAGAIPSAVADHVRAEIRAGFELVRLEPMGKRWRIVPKAGPAVEADTVVSTIPIPELLAALGEPEFLAMRGDFAFNDTYFVAVGLKRGARPGRMPSCQWVFFAGGEVFYRVSLMHNFTDERPPLFLAEVTRKGEAESLNKEQLVTRVLHDLAATGLIVSERDVALAEARLERYTYPIQTVGLPAARQALEKRLSGMGIHLLGRSGRWDYINTDGVFLQVDELLTRHAELLA